ncbi:CsbD family protein [soil metagenome]
MADNDTGPEAGAKGAAEGIKGKAKEAAGALTGDDDMKSEGKAQQDKAEAQGEVAKKEAEAEKARAKAEGHEGQQRSQQD